MVTRGRKRPSCERLESRTLLNAGDADFAFSGDGRATIVFGGDPFFVNDVALQADGKAVLAGAKGSGFAVVRLNADGSVDTSFGGLGLFESNAFAQARALAIQSDGKIVVTGWDAFGEADHEGFYTARLSSSGSLDTTFGTNGVVKTSPAVHSPHSNSNVLAIQNDGKIVVAGTALNAPIFGSINFDFEILRYNTNGTLDDSFGDGGIVSAGFGADEEALAITIDYNDTPATNPFYGRIVVVGEKKDGGPSTRFTVLRLKTDGGFDNSFDGDGQLTAPSLSPLSKEYATGVVVQAGGYIVVSGTAGPDSDGVSDDFLMARFTPNGALDPNFGPNGLGIVQTDFGNGSNDTAFELTSGYIGDLMIVGASGGQLAVAAYTSGGVLDHRFSGDGLLKTGLGAGAGVGAAGIAITGKSIAPLRRLVVVGGQGNVARYVDVGPVVSIAAPFDATASEAGQDPATFYVFTDERFETSQRVIINLSGTARPPLSFPPGSADYTGSGITFGSAVVGPTYVDIPAGQTFTTVTITPIDDTRIEGDETAIFSLASNDLFDIGTPPSTTLVIRDNDIVTGPAVTAADFVYDSGPPQRVTFRFDQDVNTSIAPSDFTVTGPSGNVPFNFAYDNITDTATLSFNGILPDGNYTARAVAAGITNASGTPMAANFDLPFFFLNGDANHDRIVDVTDLGVLATNWQNTGTFSKADFDYSGFVDVTDLGILATNWQKSLPVAGPSGSSAAAVVSSSIVRGDKRHRLYEDIATALS